MCVCETYKAKIRLTDLRSEAEGGKSDNKTWHPIYISALATDDLVT